MATDTVLKPCPFCGRVPKMAGQKVREYYEGTWAESEREEYWVIPDCTRTCMMGIAHIRAFGVIHGICYVTEKAAAKAWNERWES